MDDSSPTREQRPAHRPPAPPASAAFDNRAYQPDEGEAARAVAAAAHNDANHNHTAESFGANGTANGAAKHDDDTKEPYEAVNLELINLAPKNGHARDLPPKKDVEVDMNSTNPYDEYFVPVNEHKKYIRGEKLYVTADKRKKGGCRHRWCWTLGILLLLAAILIAVLAATGVIFTSTATPVNHYNSSISTARALGGVGAAFDRGHDHDHHDHHHPDEPPQNEGEPDQNENGHEHEPVQNENGHEHALDKLDKGQRDGTGHLDEQDSPGEHAGVEHGQTTPATVDSNPEDINEENSMYVPKTVEGVLKIDNEQLQPELMDETSATYRHFTNTLSQAIARAVFDDQLTDPDNDIRVEIVNLRSGSVIVTYRIHWIPKTDRQNIPDPITTNTLRSRLSNYLDRNSRMLNVYHVAEDHMEVKKVLDVCQDNKNGCEYGCDFDSILLEFKCTCPDDKVPDMNNPKKCVRQMDNSLYHPITSENSSEGAHRVFNFGEGNQQLSHSSGNSGTELKFTESSYDAANKFDWMNSESPKSEPTTVSILDVNNSHIFGRPNELLADPLPSSEPTPEPTSKPVSETNAKPIAEPEPEPSAETTSITERITERTSEFGPDFVPTTEPKSSPEPEPAVEYETTIKHKPEPEMIEPHAEPEPASEPKAEPTAEPSTAPEPTAEPITEPEPASAPKAERTVELEPASEPKVEPPTEPLSEPTTKPEPASEPPTKPVSEPTIELESISEPKPELTTEPESRSEPTIKPEMSSEPKAEPTTEPEPIAEPAFVPEQKAETAAEPEPASDSEKAFKLELTSKPKTEQTNESELSASKTEQTIEIKPESKIKTVSASESTTEYNSFEPINIISEINEKSIFTPETTESKELLESKLDLPSKETLDEKVISLAESVYKKAWGHDSNSTAELKREEPHFKSEINSTESSKQKYIVINDMNEYNQMSFDNSGKLESTSHAYIPDNESTGMNTSPDPMDIFKISNEHFSLSTETSVTKTSAAEELVRFATKILENDNKIENNTSNMPNSNIAGSGDSDPIAMGGNTTENSISQRFDEGRHLKYANSHISNSENSAPFTNTVETTTQTINLETNLRLSESNEDSQEEFSLNYSKQPKTILDVNKIINQPLNENNFENVTMSKSSEGENDSKIIEINTLPKLDDSIAEITTTTESSKMTTIIKTEYTLNTPVTESVISENESNEETFNLKTDWLSSNKDEEKETEESLISTIDEEHMDTDYLSNTATQGSDDMPHYGMSVDYDTANNRDKRVDESNQTEITTITVNNSPTEKMLGDYIYNVNRTRYDAKKVIPEAKNVNTLTAQQQEMHNIEENNKEPAPVWEHGEIEPEQVFYNNEDTSNELTTTSETISKSQPTTSPKTPLEINNSSEYSNLNGTVYEIPNNLTTISNAEHYVERKSDLEEHDAEMNPFLPEIDNNKSLVKKLHEGQDIEPSNINETQNEHVEEPSLEESQSKEFKSLNTTLNVSSDSESSHSEENVDVIKTTGDQGMESKSFSESSEDKSGDRSETSVNETIAATSTQLTSGESSQLVSSTFLNDVSDLVSSNEYSTEGTMSHFNSDNTTKVDTTIIDKVDFHITTPRTASSIHDVLEMELKTNAPMIDQHFSEDAEVTLKDSLSVIPIKSTKKLEKKPGNDFFQKKNDKSAKLQENNFNDISDESESSRTLDYSNYNPSESSEQK